MTRPCFWRCRVHGCTATGASRDPVNAYRLHWLSDHQGVTHTRLSLMGTGR